MSQVLKVGFLSTRLSGTDGVSLEAAKWADLLVQMGHSIAYCAGELDANGPEGMLVDKLHFRHPEIRAIHDMAFRGGDSRELRKKIAPVVHDLRAAIRKFVSRYSLDLLVAENALAIPMNVPLGIALRDEIVRSGLPAIAHHHDFAWERDRFASCTVPDILEAFFPPRDKQIRHVVINSLAKEELLTRRGLNSVIIPNVLDFARGTATGQGSCPRLRTALGFADQDIVLLQPTRVVPRKGIELAIQLAGRLRYLLHPRPIRLLVSHAAGDEGMEYLATLRRMADAVSIEMKMADDLVGSPEAPFGSDRAKFDLHDAYACADFVTYPSLIEGFGNAFLEAVYYRKPILVNRYPVYVSDIEPFGFDVIAIDGSIDDRTVKAVAQLLDSPTRIRQMTDQNYRVASEHFSYKVALTQLGNVIADLS